MKAGRAADRRHAERIAVAADPGDDAGDQAPGFRMLGRAEAQEIERRDRPRAHGEDVAQDAADPGRRALIGLDERGMVVRLHLEHADVAVADVDDAGVLARPIDDMRAGGRQLAQVEPRRLVGAMLVPHRRNDAEFGETGVAADEGDEARIFVGLQPMRNGKRLRDLGFFGVQRASLQACGGQAEIDRAAADLKRLHRLRTRWRPLGSTIDCLAERNATRNFKSRMRV